MRLPSLFGNSRDESADRPGSFDVEGTVYAIGDIHGELELLRALVRRIRSDVNNTASPNPKELIFMGDYVDRGKNSKGVLEYLASLDIPGCKLVFLRGNHEQQMIDFVDDPLKKIRWLEWGGMETLSSFGISPIFPGADDDEIIAAADEFGKALGQLRHFIEDRTILSKRIGNIIFTHAGMDPGRNIDDQVSETMLWGNDQFMRIGGPPGFWHVHGHVIHEEPGIYGNRIAIDTGAYKTGILTVIRITAQGCSFLQQTL